MNTQPQYIKIALLVGLGLLIFITCIGSYMLYTMEYTEPVPVSVIQTHNEPSQNDASSLPDGTVPPQNGTDVAGQVTPPPLPEGTPTLEEIEALNAQHEAELKGIAQDDSYPNIQRMVSPEQRIQDSNAQ